MSQNAKHVTGARIHPLHRFTSHLIGWAAILLLVALMGCGLAGRLGWLETTPEPTRTPTATPTPPELVRFVTATPHVVQVLASSTPTPEPTATATRPPPPQKRAGCAAR